MSDVPRFAVACGIVLLAMSSACAAADEDAMSNDAALVEPDRWGAVAPADDPFWDPARAYRPCPETEVRVEAGVLPYLEVRTEVCNYVTLAQPSRVDVVQGDVISLALSHQALAGDAEGHAAVQLGDALIWSQLVPVTADVASHNVAWVATQDFAAGTEVLFHLDNHGANSWRLQHLLVER